MTVALLVLGLLGDQADAGQQEAGDAAAVGAGIAQSPGGGRVVEALAVDGEDDIAVGVVGVVGLLKDDVAGDVAGPKAPLLEKPYSLAQLASKVREILDARAWRTDVTAAGAEPAEPITRQPTIFAICPTT